MEKGPKRAVTSFYSYMEEVLIYVLMGCFHGKGVESMESMILPPIFADRMNQHLGIWDSYANGTESKGYS
jgi:hypothetical protein